MEHIIADFRAKTNELFHDISEMTPTEIEETIKRHVQAKIDEYDIDATIIDAIIVGSRCRGLEKESSDLDVIVELSTNEREDDLFNALNEDGLHIGDVKLTSTRLLLNVPEHWKRIFHRLKSIWIASDMKVNRS